MARKKKDKIEPKDIIGLKYFDKLAPLLERLHDEGCQRDKAGNRTLHFDQYCLLILLYLFNPIVTSLRGIQQASELEKVQKKLGCSRAALGSLSEAATASFRRRAATSAGSQWAIGTELHLVNRLKQQHPEQEIHFLSPMVCMWATLYRIDLQHLCWSLENLVQGTPVNIIRVSDDMAHWAVVALERILAVK